MNDEGPAAPPQSMGSGECSGTPQLTGRYQAGSQHTTETASDVVAQITSSGPFYEVLIEGQAPLDINPEHVVSIRETPEHGA